jgi:4-amino-4-deoxy-L-arabinose transferase-like glycosyltransferase
MMLRLESLLRAWCTSTRGFVLSALVLLAALALPLWIGLGADPIGRVSEMRCVTVVAGMYQSGDWLVPRLEDDEVRLQKPPLFYWAGLLVETLSHDPTPWGPFRERDPWSVRAVSAAAALGLAAVLLFWGRALGGPAVALLAVGALAAMQQVTSSGRRGDAEMLLALLSTAALFSFDRADSRRSHAQLWVFAVLAGLAFLTKGTAIAFTIAAPIAAHLALRRELGIVRRPRVLACFALVAGIGLSWYVAVLVTVPHAFESFRDALFLPLGNAEARSGSAHFKAPWWYLVALPVRAAPASLLLPFVIWRLWRTRVYRGDPRWRFAALAFLAPFVAFSLLPQKQKHYTLSMLPGLALCSADAVIAAERELRPRLALALRAIGVPLAAVGIVVTVWCALFYLWVESLAPALVIAAAALPVLSFVLAALAGVSARPALWGASWIVAFLIAVGVGRGGVEPRLEYYSQAFPLLSIDERERIIGMSNAHPWYAKQVFQLLDLVKDEGD